MKIVGPSHLVIMQIGSFSRMGITAAVQFFILLLLFIGQKQTYIVISDHAISVLEVYFLYLCIYICICTVCVYKYT
jgi:hypothetical protein